jgi:hypothetical protein
MFGKRSFWRCVAFPTVIAICVLSIAPQCLAYSANENGKRACLSKEEVAQYGIQDGNARDIREVSSGDDDPSGSRMVIAIILGAGLLIALGLAASGDSSTSK